MYLCLALIISTLAANPAAADDATIIPPQQDAITVTAAAERAATLSSVGTKTDTPLRDVPQSIQVVPAQVMREQGSSALNDSIRNVSGVTQSSSGNYGFFNNYLVRGLQQTFLRNGVADGATVNGYARTLTGVERIEVLKGPGSALYGSAAPGGSVNLVLRSPSATTGYDISESAGSFGATTTTVGVTGPFGSSSALYRLDASLARTDGYRGLKNRMIDVLPRFTFLTSSRNVLFLDLGYQSADIVADTNGLPFRGTEILDVPRTTRFYTPFGYTEQQIERANAHDELMLSNALTLRVNASLSHRNLSLLRNAGGTIAAGTSTLRSRSLRRQHDDGSDGLVQVEPVFTTTIGTMRHVLLGGLELQRHDVDTTRQTAALPSIANVFAPVIPETSVTALTFAPNFDRNLVQDQTAAYLQDQVELSPRWKVRLGGRWDRFATRDADRVTSITSRRDDHPFSGQAGIVYQPNDVLSWFAGASKGHFAIFSTEAANSARQPESATQYEAGAKASLLNGHLEVNVAGFRVRRENFLVTINGEPQPVGSQQTNGIEIDAMGSVTRRLRLAANYALQNATLLSVPVTPPALAVDGNRATGVPRRSASLWSTLDLAPSVSIGAGLVYRASVFIDLANTQALPSYVTADAMLGYHAGFLDLQVNVRNLTNCQYFRNGVNSGALPGEPRSVMVTARIAR